MALRYRFGNRVTVRVRGARGLVLGACLAAAACGGSSSPGTTVAPSPAPVSPAPPPAPTFVTITVDGLDPQEITVDAGTQLEFTNKDKSPHDIAGGPDPAHPDCHEIDQVGFLVPGQTKRTGALTRTCDYHDHSNHSPIFNGRIVVR